MDRDSVVVALPRNCRVKYYVLSVKHLLPTKVAKLKKVGGYPLTTQPIHSILFLQDGSIRSILLERKRTKEDNMQIKRSSLPVSTRGKVGSASISVRENGQIGFSTKVAAFFNGNTHCIIDWDSKTRVMSFTPTDPAKPPKGWTAEDLIEIKSTKKAKGSDKKERYISQAGLFKLPDIAYDFKTAGTHTFPADFNSANTVVSFKLPKEMARVEKAKRAPRKPKTAGATAPATTVASEPQLEAAA